MQNRIPSPELAFLEPEMYILSQKILQQKKLSRVNFFYVLNILFGPAFQILPLSDFFTSKYTFQALKMPILERGSYFALGVVIFMPNNVGRPIFEFYTCTFAIQLSDLKQWPFWPFRHQNIKKLNPVNRQHPMILKTPKNHENPV